MISDAPDLFEHAGMPSGPTIWIDEDQLIQPSPGIKCDDKSYLQPNKI
jgi:hypothetical protein